MVNRISVLMLEMRTDFVTLFNFLFGKISIWQASYKIYDFTEKNMSFWTEITLWKHLTRLIHYPISESPIVNGQINKLCLLILNAINFQSQNTFKLFTFEFIFFTNKARTTTGHGKFLSFCYLVMTTKFTKRLCVGNFKLQHYAN